MSNVRVWSTYHPAALLRDPSRKASIEDHLRLLHRNLTGDGAQAVVLAVPDRALCTPSGRVTRVAFDIETYGKLSICPEQNYFHPLKSAVYDGVPVADQVKTAAISWRGEDGVLRHTAFVLSHPFDRRQLWAWLRWISENNVEVVGQNIQFDLMCMRATYPESRAWLDHPLRICELMVLNYLHNEVRPERSLKDLAPLFGITTYEKEFVRYPTDDDPALLTYNVQDTDATLLLAEYLEKAINEDYTGTAKLSPYCREWYSDLVWLSVWMSEWGIPMDEPALRELYANKYRPMMDKMERIALDKWEFPLRGEGSNTAKYALIAEAVRALPEGVTLDLQETKTMGLAYCDENRNALLGVLPPASQPAKKLQVLSHYASCAKVVDSYLLPILERVKRKCRDPFVQRPIDGIVYPRWSIVPSAYDDGSEGGTKQGRITPKGPAVQTFPRSWKDYIQCSLWFDLSRIELKVAALLSNDPVFMADQQPGFDQHASTAQLIFGHDIINVPDFKDSKYRQAGKKLNFLMLYRGGAEKFQETLMKDLGLLVDLHTCKTAIRNFWSRYRRLWEWQEGLIRTAIIQGYVDLPLLGQSRQFPGGKLGVDLMVNEICNLPVQTIAADITISAQIELCKWRKRLRLKSTFPVNIYDAIGVVGPDNEIPTVTTLMSLCLANPPYYQNLCRELGRFLPLEYDMKIPERRSPV